MEQQPDGKQAFGVACKRATGWRSAENWRIRRQLKAKRGCEQQQGSKLKNSRGPCRGVCGCLGTNVGGSLGSGWKFRGKEQPVGQEKGQSGFNPGEIPSPSPRSALPAIQRHCTPRFLLWALAHHNVSPASPAFLHFRLANPRRSLRSLHRRSAYSRPVTFGQAELARSFCDAHRPGPHTCVAHRC
jgi:hypothetical protein